MEKTMKPCRECRQEISEEALSCPGCGAPYPAKEKWDGWGFEYKSQSTLFGVPLVHISFKYRPNRTPVVAKGIIAIGQFACGIVTISQFGLGVICISQFAVAAFAVAQVALGGYVLAQGGIADSLIAQFGVYFHEGRGPFVKSFLELIKMLK
jgi:hypothetical protein